MCFNQMANPTNKNIFRTGKDSKRDMKLVFEAYCNQNMANFIRKEKLFSTEAAKNT